jgi:hypothetical protein
MVVQEQTSPPDRDYQLKMVPSRYGRWYGNIPASFSSQSTPNPVVSPPIHQRNEAIGFPAVTMRDSSQTAR